MLAKTVCVVGAGCAGIAALKECVRNGFEPTCFELDSDIGGIWLKKDNSRANNTPTTWNSLITNSSKFNNCFSDFPPLPTSCPYMTAQAMFEYLEKAVEHFDLRKYIHFNTRVIKIRKTDEHDQTGQWEVYTTDRGSQVAGDDSAGPRDDQGSNLTKCQKYIFDLVLVCSGYFKIPRFPEVTGLETYTGQVQHSFNYTSVAPYEGKNVLVVGNMISAIDIANDLTHRAKQVYLAVGRGTWILPRCLPGGRLFDTVTPRAVLHSRHVHDEINRRMMEVANHRIDHRLAGIEPPAPPLSSPIGTNDEIPVKILSGRVITLPYLTHIHGSQTHFSDGRVVMDVDSIVFSTGYRPDLSFLDLQIFQDEGKMELYKFTFPLDQAHNTLALLGQVAGDAPLFIFLETQARFAALVLAGRLKLPPRDTMIKDIEFWNQDALFRRGHFRSYFVSMTLLTETIAQEIGCYPSFRKIFPRDPRLALQTWYGPMLSAQYRLVGPDSCWEEAARTCRVQYQEGYGLTRDTGHRKEKSEYPGAKTVTTLVYSVLVGAFCSYLWHKRQV